MDIHDVALQVFSNLSTINLGSFQADERMRNDAARAYKCAEAFMAVKGDYMTAHPNTATTTPLRL